VTALTLGRRKDNLPAEVTRFIGRRRELPAIEAAIGSHRLVTLRGPGGVGKTRLALRAAALARESFKDGAWLTELSALRDPGLLARTVSGALGLPDEASGDPLAMLAGHLADRELLLLLDTCEHIVDGCAKLARTLLAAAPGLRIMATSREPLGVTDEFTVPVMPLSVPDDTGTPAADSEAVALFVSRAQAAMPGFVLTAENTRAVVQLCRRLDGIPLALELAAVRLRGMSVNEILARLHDRFGVLGTARTSTGRHRTLHAAVSWSYELCTLAERSLWARLSVFPGSFDLEAAERVCGAAAWDTLLRLVEKSVVHYDDRTLRYHMLDTMREFGTEQLAASAGELAELRTRHRDHFLRLVEKAAGELLGGEQVGWLTRLRQETDNLRVALDYSYQTAGQEPAGLRMTVLLRSYWLMVGMFTEGRRWHERAVTVAPGTRDNAWAVYGAAVLAIQQGDQAAAVPLLSRAAALAADTGDPDLTAHVTDAEGIAAFYIGDLGTSGARHEAALATYAKIDFSDAVAMSTYGRLASVYLLTGEIDRAIRLCEEWLLRCDQLGEQWGRGTALWVRGAGRWLTGDNEKAVDDALTCLRIKEKLGDLHTITMSLDLLSVCEVALGDYERAATLYGAGDALWKILKAPVLMGPDYAQIRRGAADASRQQLGDERFEAAYRRGTALTVTDAIAVARGQTLADGRNTSYKPLTKREKEIAGLVAEGLGNREIAELLFLSKRTVDSHIEHIFGKLGFSSRTQLANWVLERTGG
jgi:non-specific serine/threonine protein kinase